MKEANSNNGKRTLIVCFAYGSFVGFLALIGGLAAQSSPTVSESDSMVFETTMKPLIMKVCSDCHNPFDTDGDLDLERFLAMSNEEALEDRDTWELVARMLKAGEMPPKRRKRVPADQVASVTNWIEGHYDTIDRNAPLNPGRVTARRLNRFEYDNTIHDLLGVKLRVAVDFPPDAYGYGFDNIGDVLSVSPVLTEKYLIAAERVAQAAIPVGPPEELVTTRYTAEALGQGGNTYVQTVHDFPVDGLYNFQVAWEQYLSRGTKIFGYIYIDGKEILNQHMVFSYTNDRAFYVTDIPVSQGPHLIETRLVLAPDEEQPKPGRPTPGVNAVQVTGPYDPILLEETESYRRIFFKGPPTGNQPDYAREILSRLARRAYRRPVTSDEVDKLVWLTELVQGQGDSFEEGIQVALQAILISPHFLFRIERDPPGNDPHRITDTELASRLSYFLWSSMPDDELLDLAENNRLHKPKVLRNQVRRMMEDPRSHTLASNFAGQWLQTRNLDHKTPDRETFPTYDLELRDAMRTETEMFAQAVVSEDRSVLDFLDGRYTFLNERLAKHYGIPGVEGHEFRRIELDGTTRSGILTQASVLLVSSYPTRTSPVIRGKWVLDNILNTPPPEPPPNIPALDEQEIGMVASVRERLEEHRSRSACASCHSRMDPLGFGLENYDAIGRWRTIDGPNLIDSTGVMPDGRSFSGSAELKALLIADSSKFVRALSDKLLTYALGRGLERHDRLAVEEIVRRVEENDERFSELVMAIIESAPFQMRKSETTESASPFVEVVSKANHESSQSL